MAETKKTAIAKPVAKAVAAQPADTKTEEAKTTTAAPAAESKKEETKKTAKKTTTRKTTAKKAPAKKTAAEKKTTAKKEAVKATFNLQFAGKSYTTDDLVKIAKDVWKYDLNQKAGDFKTVELYVKPEENVVYYVINGDVTGNFGI
ncbi:MAG: hypothetical protein K2N77_09020 [Lachnospiraceae bacterium]|nr:hypothetical protein [Lachnospiraceae bacterium]MDE7259361.1 hypothetical protein [Lachnospiraceae bacterium]